MVNPSKAHSLNRRALSAIDSLNRCAQLLETALKEQTPLPPAKTRLFVLTPRKPPEEIKLKGQVVENIMRELYQHAHRLSERTWKPM